MEKHEYVSLRRRFMSCFPSSSAPSHLYVTHLSLPLQITLNWRSMACLVPLGRKGYSARKIHYLCINKSCALPLAEWDVTEHTRLGFQHFCLLVLYVLKTSVSLKQWCPQPPHCGHPIHCVHIPNPAYTRLLIFFFFLSLLSLHLTPPWFFSCSSWSCLLQNNVKYKFTLGCWSSLFSFFRVMWESWSFCVITVLK